MRKQIKQNILDIVKTIYDAHDDIKKLLKKGYKESAASLIGDCQDAALSVGNTIIDSEGEEFVTVGLIENYCKDLFEIYNSLEANDSYDCDSIYKTLNRDLTDIKKSIEKDIRAKIEVVFMPYNASMWDSLESVWKAADEDPDCDAYVVPIPYYDRNPDHSFGEFHYEGDQFPDYVPVTSYRDYDERKRKPDVIYIHNPYDDCNYVTSVTPRFYSSELKKSTDCLVYIPYFILKEINVKDDNVVENNSHFVLNSGVINSNYTVVQSYNIKDFYVKVLSAKTNLNKSSLNSKILPLGSPKCDKLRNLSKQDIIVPDSWSNIIGDKPIVLYNTGINSLLKYDEAQIEKISQVIEAFYRNKDKIVLIWRPHPLTKSTIMSMRPHLLEKYESLVKEFVDLNYGIYDDTSDLDRAILLSNAYYGDGSSVANLCRTLFENVEYQWLMEPNEFIEKILMNSNSLKKIDSLKLDNVGKNIFHNIKNLL